MAHSVTWLSSAIDDLESIVAFIARDSKTYASAMAQRILSVAASLSEFPLKGRIVPEWNEPNVRQWIVGNYRLLYEVRATSVVVLAVIHGARELPDSLRDRLK